MWLFFGPRKAVSKKYAAEKQLHPSRSPRSLSATLPPHAALLASHGWLWAVRPARFVVTEGVGSLPFCSTKSPSLSLAPAPVALQTLGRTVSNPTAVCLARPWPGKHSPMNHRQIPPTPLPRNITTTGQYSEKAKQTLTPGLYLPPPQITDALELRDRQGRW